MSLRCITSTRGQRVAEWPAVFIPGHALTDIIGKRLKEKDADAPPTSVKLGLYLLAALMQYVRTATAQRKSFFVVTATQQSQANLSPL